ncbi:MAG: carboxymuconolactone decarboxylase family protein [Bacteroidetes bacterium]|nr:carboxymuconolactone decarboxylase family protein [Bacteroidota bacterium]
MPHIPTPPNTAGIGSLLSFRPETAKPLMELAQALLRGESSLSPGERELIAAFVSSKNNCEFCTRSHAATAWHLPGNTKGLVLSVLADLESSPISTKLKALLTIASKVQQNGSSVTNEVINHARELGATDIEIHDTVLIAAAFCMYNRYVDGLAAVTPTDDEVYDRMGKHLAENGYGKR